MTVADSIQAKLLSVPDLFDNPETSYVVPIYQRNYAWGTEHIEQLIDDVRDAHNEANEEYFLGNLIVMEDGASATDFEVVDGQQRLTTLYMLLTHLAMSTDGLAEAPKSHLRYQSRPKATEALRRIAAPTSTTEPGTTEDGGIHAGYNTIERHLRHVLRDAAARVEFASYLRRSVRVVRASLPEGTDLNRYFEVMNTRGQQLQQVDIVKARLMSDLDTEEDRACFAWIWDACADMDSYLQMAIAKGTGAIALRTALFGDDWSWPQPASFADLLAVHRQRLQAAAAGGSSSSGSAPLSIANALHRYATVAVQPDADDEANVRFRSPIEFPSLLLHVLKIFTEPDATENDGQLDDKKLIDRFEKEFPREPSNAAEHVRDFAYTLFRAKFLFDNYVLKREYTHENASDAEWSLRRIKRSATRSSPVYLNAFTAVQQDTGEETDHSTRGVLLLQSMLRVTYTSPRAMHWITVLLRSLSAAESRADIVRDQVIEDLQDYAREKVREAFFTGEQPVGFEIRRIVFTYLDYLLLKVRPNTRFRFAFRNSVEHFYPQYPDPERPFDRVLDDGDPALHLLGNLALVSVSANSKFSNHPPKFKADFTEIIGQSPKLGLMADAARSQSWDKSAILRHHEEMVGLLRDDLTAS